MEMEEKKNELTEAALPVQELPADIPAEVRQKLAEDLNEEATEDLKQDMREAEKEEANDEEVKANPEMLTKSRLLKMLVKKQYVKLREVTEEEQPADLAELLEELDENNRLVVFRLLKKEVATEAFAYMSDEARDDLVNAFSDVELVSAIEEMSLDDAADLLEDMPAGVVKRVLEKSSKQTRESLNKLLNYPESSAGSLMTPEYVRLKKEMNVRQALDAIRRQGENAETIYINYVVERNRLMGVVSARDLLLADPDTPLVDIMDDNVVTVKVTDDQEFVAREMQRYDFTAMPVVDNEGMFVGIITIDDAIDVLTDESTEDMQKMAAILPADEATTYFGTSVWTHAKQRIPWLLILMLSATFTGMVTTHYEEAFVSLPLLVSFMPMLMDTAGNCGNQISTLMVRGLALGEVEPADFLKVLAKELRVSAIVGAVLGAVNGLRIYLMYTFIFAGQYDNVMGYAIVVSVSLFFSVILAKLVGGMLPLAAKKLGADPAIMATPFTDGLALQAMKAVFDYLPSAYENGANDPYARERMAEASCMAGMAFANAFLGVNHSMAHKLGAYHHLPHGVANAVILTDVIRYNAAEVPTKMGTFSQYQYPHAKERYVEAARFCGIKGKNDDEVFENFIQALEDLKDKIGIKKTIKDYGVDEKYFLDTLDEMVENAFNDQCTGANPRYPLMSEIKEIYLKCYYGK